MTVQTGRCGCQGFFSDDRSVDLFLLGFFSRRFNRSLILFATILAILPARVAMTMRIM